MESLASLIRAGWPGIVVQSAEEARVDRLLRAAAEDCALAPLEWNLAYGWVRFNNKRPLGDPGADTRLAGCLPALQDEDLDGKLVVIKGAALALDNDALAVARLRQLLNRIERHHRGRCAVVLLAERIALPAEIEPLVAVFSLPLPGRAEIAALLDGYCAAHKLDADAALRTRIAAGCSGLSELELHTALAAATGGGARIDAETAAAVVHAKEQVIAKGGVLEMVAASHGIDDIGGLEDLKRWLQRRADIVARLDEARQFGVKAPKGVLIAGMPGCGKSLTAKVAASLFGQPLLRLDIGSLLGKYVGESEHNMRRALQMAETVSPCVLWVDELEKAFVGMGSGASEVSTRLLGYFLTWMQEKSSAVFVIATANDVSALPPELLRKGRFDEIFYVGFPNAAERAQILHIHLARAGQAPERFDLAALAKRCRDYAGADIESAINEALENAFIDGVDLTQALLLDAIAATVPLRETLRDKVGQYEELFEKLRLKPASGSAGMSVAQMIRLAEDPNQVKREEVAAYPDCPDSLLEKLVADRDAKVQEAAYRNPRCPEYLLSARINIGKDDPAFDDRLLRLACTHANAPVDLLVRLLGERRFPVQLRNAIFRCTVQPMRLWQECVTVLVLDTADTDERCAFAANRALPEPLQHRLLKFGPEVRQHLAENPAVMEEVQNILLRDRNADVRSALAVNPAATSIVQIALAGDRSSDVRLRLANRLDSLCEAAQSRLAADTDVDVRLALASRERLDIREALAPSVQALLAVDTVNSVRQNLAGCSRLSEEVQLIVAKDSSADVKYALFNNRHCKPLPESVIVALAHDLNYTVAINLICNYGRQLPASAKLQLVLNVDLEGMYVKQLYDVADPDGVPEEAIVKFSNGDLGALMHAREIVNKRSSLGRALQLRLIERDDFGFADTLLDSACRLEDEVLTYLDTHQTRRGRTKLAARKDLPPSLQIKLARDTDDAIRAALRDNPCIQEEARNILAEMDLRAA